MTERSPIPDQASLRRVIVALIASELEKFRGTSVLPAQWKSWTDKTSLGTDGLGFDSLGLLQVAGRANQFFELHQIGIEDYLLARPTIGDWVQLVAQAMDMRWQSLTFQTAGSTGEPKPCAHPVAHLDDDARAVGGLFKQIDRVVGLVPPHHIYGFIYTVRLPQLLGVEFIDARTMGPGELASHLGPGALLVATPHLWRFVLASLTTLPAGTIGVTSTAPMPAALHNSLREAGLDRLVEVYGSSETNGIGWRDTAEAHFQLFDWWELDAVSQKLSRETADSARCCHSFMDKLSIDAEGKIKPVGRLDHAIQIGGMNVFPTRVRDVLMELPNVEDAAVRPFHTGSVENQRLKAFIVLTGTGLDQEHAEREIRAYLASTLAAYEIPVQFSFGPAIPRDAQGKLRDWSASVAAENA